LLTRGKEKFPQKKGNESPLSGKRGRMGKCIKRGKKFVQGSRDYGGRRAGAGSGGEEGHYTRKHSLHPQKRINS